MSKVASIQMCSTCDVKTNLAMASKLLHQAAQGGAQLAVLPEMFPMIGSSSNYKLSFQEEFGNGPIQNCLSNLAKDLNMWIVGGAIPISSSIKGKVFTASIVYNDFGVAVARYNKIHLINAQVSPTEYFAESETVIAGSDLIVVDTPIGKLGLSICYDIRFPAVYTKLRDLGAEIMVIPAAFPLNTGSAHWELLARSRAVENFCYVIGSCQGGKHESGRETYGHSLIIEPWGSVVAIARKPGASVLFADIDLGRLHSIRQDIPVHKSQRIY